MPIFLPARWLAVLPALAVFSAAGQTASAPVALPENADLSFRSSMEGYKPFADEKPIAWKQANEVARQRGGWRAYAMGSKGEKVEIDPQTFKIVDGKLFLFYNKLLTNTLPMWNKDEAHLKTNADQNWTKFVH